MIKWVLLTFLAIQKKRDVSDNSEDEGAKDAKS